MASTSAQQENSPLLINSDEEDTIEVVSRATSPPNAPNKRKTISEIADDIELDKISSAQPPSKKVRFSNQEKWTDNFKSFIIAVLMEICVGIDRSTWSNNFMDFIDSIPKNFKSPFWGIYRQIMNNSNEQLTTSVLQYQNRILHIMSLIKTPLKDIESIMYDLRKHFLKVPRKELECGTHVSKTEHHRTYTSSSPANDHTDVVDAHTDENSWLKWENSTTSMLQKQVTPTKNTISSSISVINSKQNTGYTWKENTTKPFHFTLHVFDTETMKRLSKPTQWKAKVREVKLFCDPNNSKDVLGQAVKTIVQHSQKTLDYLLTMDKKNVEITEKHFKNWSL